MPVVTVSPPMFVFPRVNYRDYFIRGGPPGSVGAATKSGWMQAEEFLSFLKHFSNYVRPSIDKKVLVLLDNHESHLYLPGIDFCRENGIVLLSFPPHCSHKLQPLDRGVYGPFKKQINTAIDCWMKNNPGKRLSIYDVPEITTITLPLSATPKNIMSGFSATGVWPFNRTVFDDSEFSPALVTGSGTTPGNPASDSLPEANVDKTSNANESSSPRHDMLAIRSTSNQFSPADIRPLPKAPRTSRPNANRPNTKGRRKGRSAVLTDSSEKKELEERARRRLTQPKKAKRRLYDAPTVDRQNGTSNYDCNPQTTGTQSSNNCNPQRKKEKKKYISDEDDDEDVDTFCLVCLDPFSSSLPEEKWIQCTTCNMWAHLLCTNESVFFVCHNCQSE